MQLDNRWLDSRNRMFDSLQTELRTASFDQMPKTYHCSPCDSCYMSVHSSMLDKLWVSRCKSNIRIRFHHAWSQTCRTSDTWGADIELHSSMHKYRLNTHFHRRCNQTSHRWLGISFSGIRSMVSVHCLCKHRYGIHCYHADSSH